MFKIFTARVSYPSFLYGDRLGMPKCTISYSKSRDVPIVFSKEEYKLKFTDEIYKFANKNT